MLRLSYFPPLWKMSTIILVHKPGKPKNTTSSYRPISLLPSLGKLFEKLLLKRLQNISEINKIIPNSQYGFRAHHSTIHPLHRLTDAISSSLEQKKYCSGIFLDVAQAFDKVWTPLQTKNKLSSPILSNTQILSHSLFFPSKSKQLNLKPIYD